MLKEFLFSKNKWLDYFLIIGLIISLITAFYVLHNRTEAEAVNDTTTVVLEWNQLYDMALRQGKTVNEVIDYLQNTVEGSLINGVLYKEPTYVELNNQRLVNMVPGNILAQDIDQGDWQVKGGIIDDKDNFLICANTDLQQQIYEQIKAKTFAKVEKYVFINKIGEEVPVLATSYPVSDLAMLGLGFPKADMEMLADQGLDVVVQLRTWPRLDEAAMAQVFEPLKDFPVTAVGFNDTELPGVTLNTQSWQKAAALMADKLNELGLPLMTAEFFSQSGIQTLAAKLDNNVVRMHTLTEKELSTMDTAEVASRFQLATAERDMRIAFVRLYSKISLDDNALYLQEVIEAIRDGGIKTGSLTTLPNLKVPVWAVALLSLGIAAAGIWLCRVLGLKKWALILGILGLAAVGGLLIIGKAALCQKLLALITAIIFPILAVCAFANKEQSNLGKAVLKIVLMTLFSLAGAVIMTAMISDRSYMTAVNMFSGVKVAHILPLLILAAVYWYRTEKETNAKFNLIQAVSYTCVKPVTIGLALLAVVGMAVIAVYLLRTGNDTMTVSSLEKAFRATVKDIFVIRPRTKEFLFGHPLMLISLYFGYRKNLWPVLVMGAIGQVSLVNTFAHVHTPFFTSLIRTGSGLALGVVIGVVFIFIIKIVLKFWQKHDSPIGSN
ncbi:MAG: DUF5693 family protein [Clostridia bacterium]|nr:DUF5693 family protein [Clostridia bacterium]